MRPLTLISIVLALSGCATPRSRVSPEFLRQWPTIQVGMTPEEVRTRLGKAPLTLAPTKDAEMEYWLYGMDDGLIFPGETYVVQFDRQRRILSFTAPSEHHQ